MGSDKQRNRGPSKQSPKYKDNFARTAQEFLQERLSLSTLIKFALFVARHTNPYPSHPTAIEQIYASEMTNEDVDESKNLADAITITAMQLYIRTATLAFKLPTEPKGRIKRTLENTRIKIEYWLGSSLDLIDGMVARKTKIREKDTEETEEFNIGASVDALADRLGECFIAELLTYHGFITPEQRENIIVANVLSTLTKALAELAEITVPEQSQAGMIARRKIFSQILGLVYKVNTLRSRGTDSPKALEQERKLVEEITTRINTIIGNAQEVAASRLSMLSNKVQEWENTDYPLWENLTNVQRTELVKIFIINRVFQKLYGVNILEKMAQLQKSQGIKLPEDWLNKIFNIIPPEIQKSLEEDTRITRVIQTYLSELDLTRKLLIKDILLLVISATSSEELNMEELSKMSPEDLMRKLKLQLTLSPVQEWPGLSPMIASILQQMMHDPQLLEGLNKLYSDTNMTPYIGNFEQVLRILIEEALAQDTTN